MSGNPFEDISKNPYINPPSEFENYNESIKALKDNPEALSFSKMCYELFEHQEVGRKFMEYILINKILVPACAKNNPMMQIAAVYTEGFKGFFLMIRNAVRSHKQFIAHETQVNVRVETPNDGSS